MTSYLLFVCVVSVNENIIFFTVTKSNILLLALNPMGINIWFFLYLQKFFESPLSFYYF